MAVDIFMKIDDVKGESADDKHKGEIDVLAWKFGGQQSGTSQVGTGGGSGKVQIQDLEFTKNVDRSSPVLLSSLCTGSHFKVALLTVRKAGGKAPVEYLKITMTDLIVSKIEHGTEGTANQHTETVWLNFATVKFEYTPQNADGTGGAAIVAGHNIAANKPL
ncbi:MAG TPA: type VI secretion system tube protein Hcp [Polyangiaceae bacterium]|jgi:type VI secretion system secreted protein Hcp